VSDARRVLVAWIVATQILAFPCLAFGAFMALLGMRPGTDSWIPMLVILVLSFLIEGGIAFFCGAALRERLRNRLSFSPLVVALASCVGLFGGALLVGALGMGWLWAAAGQVEPALFLIVTACGLGLGSGLGALLGCRYRPG